MEITGKLYSVENAKTFDSGHMVQEFYLDCTHYDPFTGEKKDNFIKFQNWNEKINFNNILPNDNIKVSFGIKGSWYIGRDGNNYFSQNLNAYKVEKVVPLVGGVPKPQAASQQTTPPTPAIVYPETPPQVAVPPTSSENEEDDDLPF